MVVVEDPYFSSLICAPHLTYTPPSRHTLTTYLLPAEETRITLLEEDRLKLMKFLTMIIDEWDDQVKRSIYGSLVSEPRERPVILDLADLTGKRSTADKIVEISDKSLEKRNVKAKNITAILKNWTFQCPLTPGDKEGEDDAELLGLKDITAEELEAEFNWLQPAAGLATSWANPSYQCEPS